MKSSYLLTFLILLTASAFARETVAEYDWSKLLPGQNPPPGEVISIDGRSALRIKNTSAAPLRVNLLNIQNPQITTPRYGLVGEVKYEAVEGKAYLETWNHFPERAGEGPAGKYFSRTLAEDGPMATLTGTSTWRDFLLPFFASDAGSPEKIEFNLYLPAQGTVYLSPVRLLQYEDGEIPHAGTGAWWPNRTAGLIGGIGGIVLGGLASCLALLASRGRARNFVLGASVALIAIGIASAVAGLVAVLQRQPYAVWFPLLLVAVLLLAIVPFRLNDFRRQYEELEMRRISSLDT